METRIDRLRAAFAGDSDAALICDPLNQFYLSGFSLTDGYVVVTRDNAILLADSRYIEAAQNNAKNVEVRLLKSTDDLKAALNGCSVIAFEDNYVTCADLRSLEKLFGGVKFNGLGNALSEIRERKYEGEKELVISAQRIAEAAFDDLLGVITPDMTEKEVALHLEFYMRSHGADGVSFETIAVSGSHSSMPHGTPEDRKLEKGFLTLDFGALYRGYCSDMTRTVVIGKADGKMRDIYNTVLEAQLAAEEALCAGKVCSDIDKIARKIIEAKYPGTFGHGLGHGVGLYIHEEPRLSPKCHKVLETGNIVTIEPGIYLPGEYGVRIEDMGYITESGAEILTKAPKNLIEV